MRVLDNLSTGKRENLAPWLERIELIEGDVVRLCASVLSLSRERLTNIRDAEGVVGNGRVSILLPADGKDICGRGIIPIANCGLRIANGGDKTYECNY